MFRPTTTRELPAIYEAIARELASRSDIAYLPSRLGGGFRRIAVRVLTDQPACGAHAERLSRSGERAVDIAAGRHARLTRTLGDPAEHLFYQLRAQLEPLFVKCGVQVVFSGHDRIYEQSSRSRASTISCRARAGSRRKAASTPRP